MSMNIEDTLAPTSDQLDAIELVAGPRIFQIAKVSRGSVEQPVNVHFVDFPRPWRPSKGMRRVLAACWGPDAAVWEGRFIKLYFDPDVTFGKDKPGGTRIAALSHIDKSKKVPLLVSRGKSALFVVEPLDAPTTQPAPAADLNAAKQQVWQAHKNAHPDLTDADRKIDISQLIAEQGLDPNSAADMGKLADELGGE